MTQGRLSKMLPQERERTLGCGILEGKKQREALKVKARTVSPRPVQFLLSEVVVRLPSPRSLSRVSWLPGSRCSAACRGAAVLERSPDSGTARTWLVFYLTTGECHSSENSPSNDLSKFCLFHSLPSLVYLNQHKKRHVLRYPTSSPTSLGTGDLVKSYPVLLFHRDPATLTVL